jgi:uncharacterized membrane protein
MHTLSAADVAIIARTARSTKTRTRGEAYSLIQRCDRRLKQAAANELALAPDVRLPLAAVIRLIWTARKIGLAQWKAARAAEAVAPAAPDTEAYVTDDEGNALFV